MKRVFAALGVIFLLLIIAGGVWLYFTAQKGMKLDESSRSYVQSNMEKLAEANFYGKVFQPMASLALMEAVSQEEWHNLSVRYFQTLGELEEFGVCEGQAHIQIGDDPEVTANYKCPARFAKGDAMIDVTLIQEDEVWKVMRIYVNSPLFAQ